MRGTGGLRKLRFSFPGRSKQRSVRVCYIDFPENDTVYLITVYPKSIKDNLSQKERAEIRTVIALIGKALRGENNE